MIFANFFLLDYKKLASEEYHRSMTRIGNFDAKLDASSFVLFLGFFSGYEGYSLTQRWLDWRIALHPTF